MKINFIRLKNYRQYKDVKIDFSTSESQNITIIQGNTGAGKTNILNALTWCLYGEEKHLDKHSEGLPIFTTSSMEEIKEGENLNVGVQIDLRDDEGNKYILGRGLTFKKTSEVKFIKISGPSLSADGSTFQMIKWSGNESNIVEDPDYVLKRMIPESIEEYFFFDGEKLDDYFKDKSDEKIRNSVFRISQLFLLENAIEHLRYKKNDFIRQSGELSPKAEEIKVSLNKNEELLKEQEKHLDVFKNNKRDAEKKEKEYSEKLKTSSPTNIKQLELERNQTEESLDKIEEKLQELENEKLKFLIEMTAPMFAYEPILRMKGLIDMKEEAGDIPPDYKRNFLEKLLANGKCICGSDILEENTGRKSVNKLLEGCNEVNDICQEIIEENRELTIILNKLNSFKEEQEHFSKEIGELENERKKKSERLKIIHEIIGKSDIEQIKYWEEKLNEYKNLKEDFEKQIILLEYQIEEMKKTIEKERNEIEKELSKEERFNELRTILHFCEESLNVLELIKNEIMEDVRKEIESKTREQFFNLIWKKGTYKDVNIDSNYNISVIHQSGKEARGTLSKGETQILALSFMSALNSVSGFNIPIVIDTPLGRISEEPRNNIADALPIYLEERQLILLVTDTEYTAEVRQKLLHKVGKEYIINFKETKEGGESVIETYEN